MKENMYLPRSAFLWLVLEVVFVESVAGFLSGSLVASLPGASFLLKIIQSKYQIWRRGKYGGDRQARGILQDMLGVSGVSIWRAAENV